VDDIVGRIMAFDKNKDGKVIEDELPERMHHLIALGDTNKDGALDRDEIRKLATKLAAGDAIRVDDGSGPGAAGGFGVGGGIRGGGGGPGPGPAAIKVAVEDLKLSSAKKEQAMAAVKAHEEKVRKLMEQARAELLEKMKDILSEEELKDFRAALDRFRGGDPVIIEQRDSVPLVGRAAPDRPRGATVISDGPRDTPEEGGQKKLDPPKK
jgi:EF hand